MWTFKREQESCEEDQAEFELKGNMRVGNIDSVFMKQGYFEQFQARQTFPMEI